jgi:hypothetical protein
MVNALINRHADLNLRNNNNETALISGKINFESME